MTVPAVYLVSRSPRRRELLEQVGIAFESIPGEVDETRVPNESPGDYVRRLALEKARAGWRPGLERPVLGADTIVTVDDELLGKPLDRDEALAALARLSGRSHVVYSAVAVKQDEREASAVNVSRVTFREIDDEERLAYWQSGEPVGKAGSYAIQGVAGAFVEELRGSYSAVMGLPLHETVNLLREFGVGILGLAGPRPYQGGHGER